MKITILALLVTSALYSSCEQQGSDLEASATGCKMTSVKVNVSGTVRYLEYQNGPIEIYVAENESEMCGDDAGTRMVRTPGKSLDKIVLDAPGAFNTTVEVNYIKGEVPPLLDLTVHHFNSSSPRECIAGAFVTMASDNAMQLQMELIPERCIIRL